MPRMLEIYGTRRPGCRRPISATSPSRRRYVQPMLLVRACGRYVDWYRVDQG